MSVNVLNIDSQTVVILDIGESISPGGQVSISDDRAHRSTDLWRAISQRRLYQLKAVVPSPSPPPVTPPTPQPVQEVLNRLDQIIALLERAPTQFHGPPPSFKGEVAENDPSIPVFLPSMGVREVIQGGEGLAKEATSTSDIQDASAKLKAMRAKQ